MCKAAVTMDTFLQSLVVERGSLRLVVDNARYHSTELPPRLRQNPFQNQDITTGCRWSVDRGSPKAVIEKEAPNIPQRQPSLEVPKIKEPPTLPQRQTSLEDEQRNNNKAVAVSGEDPIATALQREQERIYEQIQKQRQQKKAQADNNPNSSKPTPKPLFGVAPKARPGTSSLLDFDDDDDSDDDVDVGLYQKAFCTLRRQTSHSPAPGERLPPLPCPPPL